MPEPLSLPSQRVRARHRARRASQTRVIVTLTGGALLLATGIGAATAAFAHSGGEFGTATVNPSVTASVQAHTVAYATPPRAEALSATSGSLVAGESVTITGVNLAAVDRVTFGAQDAVIAEATENAVTVTVPTSLDYTAGTVPVIVHAHGIATEPLDYTYEARSGIDRQLEYALAHWDSYNLEQYGNYNPGGGDCMNFVSQTLAARGWEQSSEWYNNGRSATENWRYVPTFEKWMKNKAEEFGAQRLELDQRDQVKLGDLVVFDWNNNGTPDHIQIVSGIVHNEDGSISILMAGHNVDTDYRDLDRAITVEHPGAPAHFWSLPAA